MRSHGLLLGLLLPLLPLASLAGCATETVAERQFAEMREQVTRMQVDRDKVDQRIAALEVAVSDMPAAPGAAADGDKGPARVVQLGGPSDSEPADPNDATPRPDIRVTGAGGGTTTSIPKPRSGKSRGHTDDASDFVDSHPDGSPRSSALDPDAKRAYEAALAQVQGKQYDKGLEGLSAFLVRWPDHPYAENAMYWRGEAYFAKGEYLRAAEQFDAVLARFGAGTKGPDALLKLGMCHDRLGAPARAREYWNRLKTDFPRSDAAKRIPSSGNAREDSSPKGPKENR